MTFAATVLTLYPEMFPGPLGASLAGRALAAGAWSLKTVQIRDFASDKHHTVDDTPAGGGAGMVLRVDVLAAAVDHALATQPRCPVLAMTPRGKPITQTRIRELAAGPGVTLLCGRFEGFDERIFEGRPVEEVSLGDIVLSGGEPAAIAILLLLGLVMTFAGRFPDFGALFPQWLYSTFNPNDKTFLAPYRFIHFVVIVILVIRFVPKDWPGLEWKVFDPLVVCGQQSLAVFCVGVFLSFVAHFLLSLSSGSVLVQVLVSIAGISIMTLVAYYISWSKRQDKPLPKAPAPKAPAATAA